jgi:hypothetical protein
MAKVKIQGNVSGTGVFTITPPATSTDRTLTLPDSAGTILDSTSTLDATKLTGNLPAISGASLTNLPGGGITEADQWRVSTYFTGDAIPISTNLERVDTDGFGKLGTGMSQTSGIFTFPSTGVWLIRANVWFELNANQNLYLSIDTTLNNSSYDVASVAYGGSRDTSYIDISVSCEFMFDVTSTSTHKVRFSTRNSDGSSYTEGNTSKNDTHFTFIRLGDT